MFSVHLTVGLSSKLGQRLGFVQHLAGLALVNAIKSIPGCDQLELKLKWPNDIYYQSGTKLGGVLVNSVLRGTNVHCFIGCGLNVTNSSPTLCINDIIKLATINGTTSNNGVTNTNNTNGSTQGDTSNELNSNAAIPPVSVEQVIALTLNELDVLIKAFERRGVEYIKSMYHANWVHSQQLVRIANTKQVIVEGLDDQGYLSVRDVTSGLLMSVHPDGNRFDMLHNLLVRKTSP